MKRLVFGISVLLVSVLMLGACAEQPARDLALQEIEEKIAESGGPVGEPVLTVEMVAGNRFEPAEVTINAGETILWVNVDSQIHDAKFEEGASSPSVMNAGDEWARAFAEPGEYPYICTYHESDGMVGTVIVQ